MQAMVMTAPVAAEAVISVAAVEAKSRTIITNPRSEEDADANRWNKYHRPPRWWRVIITGRGCAVRLNHIRAGV
jgi:hypothetical protein